ncbi:tRNA (34-2'-O)-methyltransferase regulator WDR6-like [Ara ararauna]
MLCCSPLGLWGEVLVLAGMAARGGKGEISPLGPFCLPRSWWGPAGLCLEAPQHLPSRRHLLCSAATGGGAAFWDISSPIVDAVGALHQAEGEMQPLPLGALLLTVMAHSCRVNSLHIHETPEGQYLVASKSDDGSIYICLLEVTLHEDNPTAGTCLHVLEQVAQPCAHITCVMGIRVLQPDLLLSALVDQCRGSMAEAGWTSSAQPSSM